MTDMYRYVYLCSQVSQYQTALISIPTTQILIIVINLLCYHYTELVKTKIVVYVKGNTYDTSLLQDVERYTTSITAL